MVNALHHPPKSAFPQSADNLICNTTQKEKEERGRAGKERTEALDMWT